MLSDFYTRQGGWPSPPKRLDLRRELFPAGHVRFVDHDRAADLATPPSELNAGERELRRLSLRRAVRHGEIAAKGLEALDAYEARQTVEVVA